MLEKQRNIQVLPDKLGDFFLKRKTTRRVAGRIRESITIWLPPVFEPVAATAHRAGSRFVKDAFPFENVGAVIERPHCTAGFCGGE